MPNILQRVGGVGAVAAEFTVNDDGSMVIKDATGATIFSLSAAGALTLLAGLAVTALTATGNVALGNASTDTIGVTGALTVTGLMAFTAQTITVDGNEVLTYGTPGAGETLVTSNVLLCNNTSGSSKDVTLPATAGLANRIIFIFNVSAQNVVILDAAASTLATITAGKGIILGSNGTGIGVIAGA